MSEWIDEQVELADGYTLRGWVNDDGKGLVVFGRGRKSLFIERDSAILGIFGKDVQPILKALPKAAPEPKASEPKAPKSKAPKASETPDIAAITAAVLAALQAQ